MTRVAIPFSLSFLLVVASEGVSQAGDPCFEGAFEDPFPHENNDDKFTWSSSFWSSPPYPQKSPFNALHLTLIPWGPYRGRVLAWSYNPNFTTKKSLDLTRWSIIQPELPNGNPSNDKFWNFELPHGAGKGDLGCAVSSWTEDGRHFLAGGTTSYEPLVGAKLVYLFDPTKTPQNTVPKGANMWLLQPSLQHNRWYPSVVRIPRRSSTVNKYGHMLVIGGADSTNSGSQTTYESWVAPSPAATQGAFELKSPGNQLFNGPTFPNGTPLGVYPRAHLLSNSDVFQSTCSAPTITLASMLTHHLPSKDTWTQRGDVGAARGRIYGSSVILPNISPAYQNAVMILGGNVWPGPPPSCRGTPGSRSKRFRTVLQGITSCRGYGSALQLSERLCVVRCSKHAPQALCPQCCAAPRRIGDRVRGTERYGGPHSGGRAVHAGRHLAAHGLGELSPELSLHSRAASECQGPAGGQ